MIAHGFVLHLHKFCKFYQLNMQEAFSIDVLYDIRQISPAQWNSITGNTMYNSYDWQLFRQMTLPKTCPKSWVAYIVVRQNNRLIGLAAAHYYPFPPPIKNNKLRTCLRFIVGPISPINISVHPQTLDGINTSEVHRLVIEGLNNLRKSHKLPVLRLTFIDPNNTGLLDALSAAGFTTHTGFSDTRLDINQDNFKAYKLKLAARPRRHLKQQQKRATEANIQIKTNPQLTDADTNRIMLLLQNVANRGNGELTYSNQLFKLGLQILGNNLFTLFTASYQNNIVACLISYNDSSAYKLAAIGLDYKYSNQFNLYRVLTYAAIQHATDIVKATYIVGGMTNYPIKQRLGFEAIKTLSSVYVKPQSLTSVYTYTPKSMQA